MADIVTYQKNGTAEMHDPLVCHCLEVRQSAVTEAIEIKGARSVDEVRLCTGAGAGCGSCHRLMERQLKGEPTECGPCIYCYGCNSIKALCACESAA